MKSQSFCIGRYRLCPRFSRRQVHNQGLAALNPSQASSLRLRAHPELLFAKRKARRCRRGTASPPETSLQSLSWRGSFWEARRSAEPAASSARAPRAGGGGRGDNNSGARRELAGLWEAPGWVAWSRHHSEILQQRTDCGPAKGGRFRTQALRLSGAAGWAEAAVHRLRREAGRGRERGRAGDGDDCTARGKGGHAGRASPAFWGAAVRTS